MRRIVVHISGLILVVLLLCTTDIQPVSAETDVKGNKCPTKNAANGFAGIKMVRVPAGSCIIRNNGSARTIHVGAILVGKYEVTQEQFKSITGFNWSYFRKDAKNPVENVNWYDAVEFCNILSMKAGFKPYYNIDKQRKDPENKNGDDFLKWTVTVNIGANGFRLPTSDEWEYACRAGSTMDYYWGDSIDGEYCWYTNNAGGKTHPIGMKKPNAWGLFDMSGNVWEWCYDWHPDYPGLYRIWRGGSWGLDKNYQKSGCINYSQPIMKGYNLGFRIVRDE